MIAGFLNHQLYYIHIPPRLPRPVRPKAPIPPRCQQTSGFYHIVMDPSWVMKSKIFGKSTIYTFSKNRLGWKPTFTSCIKIQLHFFGIIFTGSSIGMGSTPLENSTMQKLKMSYFNQEKVKKKRTQTVHRPPFVLVEFSSNEFVGSLLFLGGCIFFRCKSDFQIHPTSGAKPSRRRVAAKWASSSSRFSNSRS